MKQVAIKRLLRDLKEVLENPLEGVAAAPLADDLMTWHGNAITSDGPLAEVPVHFVLLFPDNYPTAGPEVRLFHALPHPNVLLQPLGAPEGATYRCHYWDCNPSLNQWSPAFTVSSVLIQLQAFLLSPDLLYANQKITVERARKAAFNLKILGHPHRGDCPVPAFPTPEDMAIAPRLQQVEVAAPSVNPELLIHLPTVAPDTATAAAAGTDPEGWQQPSGHSSARPWGTPTPTLAASFDDLASAGSAANGAASGYANGKGSGSGPLSFGLGAYAIMAHPEWEAYEQLLRQPPKSSRAAKHKPSSSGPSSASSASSSSSSQGTPTSGSLALSSTSTASTSAASISPAPSAAADSAAKQQRPCRRKPLLDDSILKQRQASLISDVLKVWARRREAERAARAGAARLAVHAAEIRGVADHRDASMGLATGSAWDLLTPDAMTEVLLRLESPRDIAALGSTCKALRAASSEGEVWREMLRRRFPASILHASCLADWRIAYNLEANCVLPELTCFYSKTTFQDEVLGLPIAWSLNPKTKRVDYIAATCPDLLALSVFQAGLVTVDLEGAAFKGVLPLYISEDHFARALPHLPLLLRQLAPHRAVGLRPGADVPPDAWLEVLGNMLNTCAVLLCDRGIGVSERALNTFVAVHRLLMAICQHYQLWGLVERRVQRFLSSEAERSKAQAPSLGALLPLLALSRRHNWRDVLPVVLGEAQDRSILWICKHDPSLEKRLQRAPEAPADPLLLRGAWEGNKVSKRLFQFHAAFLELVARPAGCSLGAVMHAIDSLYGRPGVGLRAAFQREVKRILGVDSFQVFYESLGLRTLTPAQQCRALRLAYAASARKGYHRPGMDFSKVQAGGVSPILLKGESFTAPPGMKAIAVDERWHSCRAGSFAYLDASCLVYGTAGAIPAPLRDGWGNARGPWCGGGSTSSGSGGRRFTCPPIRPGGPSLELLGVVDYCRSHGGRVGAAGAVQHSGDILDGNDGGQHTISINLAKLGPQVQALVLTMSAWAGARLSHIDQPYIAVRDPATGTELCQYFLEDLSPQQRASSSSVVMCCIHRSQRAAGQWEVVAVGQVGQGDASEYVPLLETIQRLPPFSKC